MWGHMGDTAGGQEAEDSIRRKVKLLPLLALVSITQLSKFTLTDGRKRQRMWKSSTYNGIF